MIKVSDFTNRKVVVIPQWATAVRLVANGIDGYPFVDDEVYRFTNFVYTRYADDLAFSFNFPDVVEMLMREVPRIVEKHGFRINPSKTHLQCAKAGRRIITGVAVDSGVHPTREIKRRIRAAAHQSETGRLTQRTERMLLSRALSNKQSGASLRAMLVGQLRGLEEWAKLKLPKVESAATRPATVQAATTTHRVAQVKFVPLGQRKLLWD